jgi:hypothetical protein
MRVYLGSLPRIGLGLLALLVSCTSDKFSAVGSGLPLDVGQEADSVLVLLEPPLFPEGAGSVPIVLEESYEERALLYLGNRDEGQWKATPLFVLDFAQAELINGNLDLDLSDSLSRLPLRIGMITSVDFRVRQTREDNKKGISRDFQLREVVGSPTLDASLLDRDVSTLLGPVVSTVTGAAIQQRLSAPVDRALALSWYEAGDRLSLALHDLTTSQPFTIGEGDSLFGNPGFDRPNSNFVSLASTDYTEPFSPATSVFWERVNDKFQIVAYSEVVPRLVFELRADSVASALRVPVGDVSDVVVEIPVVEDMTHLQQAVGSRRDLTLSTYRASRVWMDFDVANSAVPGDATINEAVLSLHVRPGSLIGGEVFSDVSFRELRQSNINTRSFEVSLVDAAPISTDGLGVVRNSSSSVRYFPEKDVFRVDVTDFAQRDANLLLSDDLGILIRLNASQTTLNSVDFYGMDAPDSLRPRLDIRFTPPADFWE